jgi:hypothetical protein
MVRNAETGKYRRTRLFVLTLGYSRKSVRLIVERSSSRVWAELHERAFRRLGGVANVVVLDNLREGVAHADIYDPQLNPLYRDVLKHYAWSRCRAAYGTRIARARWSPASATRSVRRCRASDSRPSTRRRRTSTAGTPTGPTRASTAPPSARSR